jgi:hypothetical protein
VVRRPETDCRHVIVIKYGAFGGEENRMKQNTQTADSGHSKSGVRTDPLGPNTEIGRKLKEYYNDLVSEDVPDRFADLLKQLETSEKSSASRDGS